MVPRMKTLVPTIKVAVVTCLLFASAISFSEVKTGNLDDSQSNNRAQAAEGTARPDAIRYANQFACPSHPGCKGRSDFGAQIMAAYADCPVKGCRIRVPANPSCWAYNTPLVFGDNGKNVILEGDGTTQTCLFFDSVSGSAITLDTGGSVSGGESVLRNLVLLGRCSDWNCAGVTSTAVTIGPANGTGTLSFEDFQIGLQVGVRNQICPGGCGFLNGFVMGGAAINLGLSLYNTSIQSSGTAINVDSHNYENLHWFGGFCAQNNICFSGAAAGDYYFYSISFDDNALGAISSKRNAGIWCYGCHFENAGQGASSNYIQASGNSIVELYGGAIYERRRKGSSYPGFITFSGSVLVVDGTVVSSSGDRVEQVVDISGVPAAVHLRVVNTSPGAIPNDFNPSYTATRIFDAPLRGDAVNANVRIMGYQLTLGGHLQQVSSGNYAGSCRMSDANTCTFSIGQPYAAPLCVVTAQGGQPVAAACSVSGRVVTIRAASPNSMTWAAVLVGNPN
jgi:hypothetical protein